jgi:hypothetical protein
MAASSLKAAMKLIAADIVNFRSIKSLEVTFDPSCLVLVGINESGKSNILKALATLGSFVPTRDDVRERAEDETPSTTSEITFTFEMSPEDHAEALAIMASKILANDGAKSVILKKDGKWLTVDQFIRSREYAFFETNVLTGAKRAGSFTLDNAYTDIAPFWRKPKKGAAENFETPLGPLQGFELINVKDFPDIPDALLELPSVGDIDQMTYNPFGTVVTRHLPATHLWQYKEENLLPSSVDMTIFAKDPDSCLPLKNMFILAGIKDISASVRATKALSSNSQANYFSSIASKATKHFQEVWPDHSIKFELRPEGTSLIPGIRENNVYDISRRSDGFKRFVSFLLLVSVLAKSGSLTGTLLLIDEPEISLHPSGSRYLRDEILRVSQWSLGPRQQSAAGTERRNRRFQNVD